MAATSLSSSLGLSFAVTPFAGEPFSGELFAYDPDADLAVFKVVRGPSTRNFGSRGCVWLARL